jgi:hypothetical protein
MRALCASFMTVAVFCPLIASTAEDAAVTAEGLSRSTEDNSKPSPKRVHTEEDLLQARGPLRGSGGSGGPQRARLEPVVVQRSGSAPGDSGIGSIARRLLGSRHPSTGGLGHAAVERVYTLNDLLATRMPETQDSTGTVSYPGGTDLPEPARPSAPGSSPDPGASLPPDPSSEPESLPSPDPSPSPAPATAPTHPPTPAPSTPAGALDPYGGVVPGVARQTGHFAVAQSQGRWLLVTPSGNGTWLIGVYNVSVDTHVDDMKDTYKARVIRKYGDSDITWGPQQVRRLKSWGFTALGEYANNWTLPWTRYPSWPQGTQPAPIPAVPYALQGALYSQTNLSGYADHPVKELYWALSSSYRGYRGQFPDVFDPSFDQWVRGRVASGEFAAYARSEWAIGFSSDDTDYLTGFGPGPDFPAIAGNTHPHLGLVALMTPPTQTRSKEGRITYTDTNVYTKLALRDFLRSKYRSVEALNKSWGTSYTTFDSDGGWPNGHGLLDEDGSASWNPQTLGGVGPGMKTDLDEFLFRIAQRYFAIYHSRIKERYPNMLYLGPTTIGGWGTPPRRQILAAARGNVDVLRSTLSLQDLPAKLEFIKVYAGDLPVVNWVGATANADSALFRYPGDYPTQQARGAWYAQTLQSYFDATPTGGGVRPIMGIQFWEFLDNYGEKKNFGLVSLSDNAYDGREAVRAKGTDPWGYPTGGEEKDYGDFISAVRSANSWIAQQLRAGR